MDRDTRDGKIVGGTAAEVGEFPFLVPIKYSNGNQFCGGSIINERFVLTAAHCVPDGDPTGLMITAGDYCTNIAEDSEYNIGVSRVILSDDWTGDNLAGDLALLELAAPLDLSSGLVGPIQLSDGGSCEEGTLTVAGWGYTRSGGRSSLYPQKVDVDVVPLDTCRSQYAKETLYDSQICAASPGSDSCQGDSGGPLFNLNCDSKPVLVGVVSWGYGCADARYSGVYTRVSSYKDWINTNTV
nr:hypothetical protein BaRGS_000080 [Batillaria attramentaria]